MKENLAVLFRADRSGPHKGSVTAVFPTLPGSRGTMSCYAHIGQHSSCSFEWYHTTRPATPQEYADLLAELTQIYNDCNLMPCRRITQAMRDARNTEERRAHA